MVKWNESNSKQLLVAVIGLLGGGTVPYDKLATIMGEGYTPSAVMQQYQKLKKEGQMAVEKTTGRKKTAECGGKSASKRKAKDVEEEDDDDEERRDTPVKKKKVKGDVKEAESDEEV